MAWSRQKTLPKGSGLGFYSARDGDPTTEDRPPLVTQVAPFTNYYPAEDYHQEYLIKNPNGYTCHFLRDF